jgi:hypothetical protein
MVIKEYYQLTSFSFCFETETVIPPGWRPFSFRKASSRSRPKRISRSIGVSLDLLNEEKMFNFSADKETC